LPKKNGNRRQEEKRMFLVAGKKNKGGNRGGQKKVPKDGGQPERALGPSERKQRSENDTPGRYQNYTRNRMTKGLLREKGSIS